MVAEGSGGAFTDEQEILYRLPYAKGLQYIQFFWTKYEISVAKKHKKLMYETARTIL